MATLDTAGKQGVTAPQGFLAAGHKAGIKPSGKPDMALVLNQGPEYHAAAVFTQNKVVAAPVKWSRKVCADGSIQAVLFNSGNANACTGQQGYEDVETIVGQLAKEINIPATEIAMCSTGLIGDTLPVPALCEGVKALAAGLGDHGEDAARAIMTTDTVEKQTLVVGDGYVLGGMGKGVGMMAPSLATMLVLLTTDAQIEPQVAQQALEKACALTFNTLDIDGSTSTNDTVILLANGASGVKPSQEEVDDAVFQACAHLADQLQADAEGVTKRIKVEVLGAHNDAQALEAARTIARDNLFKCAMFGSDPNWGRVLAAVGMAKAEMDPDNISVYFNGEPACVASTGQPTVRNLDLSGKDIHVQVDLGTGEGGCAFVRTTDLSHSYVEINSAYSS